MPKSGSLYMIDMLVSVNILTLATSAPRSAARKKPHYLSGKPRYLRGRGRPFYLIAAGKPLYFRDALRKTSLAPRPRKTSLPSAERRGKPLYLRGAPRKTSLPWRRGQTSLTPRRAPNNEMSLEVTQRNYVDDNGHGTPGRANTCNF